MTDPPSQPILPARGNTQPITVFGGRYAVERELARGGMGTVYAARDTLLDRRVALKVLRPESGRAVQDEFLREARAVAALKHPGIADVYDAGIEGDVPYIVMEYVPGETLRALLAREGPLHPSRAAALAAEVAAALEFAHRRGVIHCDIKPGNILLPAAHTPRIVDFGIARHERDPDPGATAGTAGYVAPEQAAGNPVDGRADVYSLGAVLYEMLTGRPPHQSLGPAEPPVATPAGVPPAHIHNPAVPRTLSELVARSLQPDREARPPSAAAFAVALTAFLDAQTPVALPRPEPSRDTARMSSGPQPGSTKPERTTHRKQPWVALAVVGLLAVIGAAGGALLVLNLLGDSGSSVTVPAITGVRIDAAAERLQAQGLTVATPVERIASAEPLGTVIRQEPAAGSRLSRNTAVHITISMGP